MLIYINGKIFRHFSIDIIKILTSKKLKFNPQVAATLAKVRGVFSIEPFDWLVGRHQEINIPVTPLAEVVEERVPARLVLNQDRGGLVRGNTLLQSADDVINLLQYHNHRLLASRLDVGVELVKVVSRACWVEVVHEVDGLLFLQQLVGSHYQHPSLSSMTKWNIQVLSITWLL